MNYRSKKYSYEYEEYEDGKKGADTMLAEIMEDAEFASLEELVIGCWGEAWEDNPQPIVDGIVANAAKFSHIKSIFFGDMDFEECEVSWIMQADYSKLWAAMPQLECFVVKGSSDLVLGEISHANLKSLTVICGGLPVDVINSIKSAKLPSLEKLLLYVGVEDYGFDGDISDIKALLSESDFPKLTYLGITDSELQDEICAEVLESKYISQIATLDLSMGTLTDKGGALLLEKLPSLANIKTVDLQYHYLSDEMMKKLTALDKEVCVDEQQEQEEYDGEIWTYPMLTE